METKIKMIKKTYRY